MADRDVRYISISVRRAVEGTALDIQMMSESFNPFMSQIVYKDGLNSTAPHTTRSAKTSDFVISS